MRDFAAALAAAACADVFVALLATVPVAFVAEGTVVDAALLTLFFGVEGAVKTLLGFLLVPVEVLAAVPKAVAPFSVGIPSGLVNTAILAGRTLPPLLGLGFVARSNHIETCEEADQDVF